VRTLDLIITFDTEDVYNPPEAGRDGVIKDLADILSDEGVPANFMLIASRAALLTQRGREDVIAAVKRHSVGVHTLSHEQPVTAVQVAELDWAAGLEVCRRNEREAFRTVAEAFDCQPVCLSSHAYCEAPQVYVVARELGLPFAYGYPLAPPLFNVSRVCGTLNFPCEHPLKPTDAPFLPYFGGFDDLLASDPEFVAHLERFERHIDACLTAREPLMLIHPCHPVKTYTLDWIDDYLTPNGVNIPPEERPRRQRPGLRTAGQMDMVMRNFRRLARFIVRHPHLNVLSLSEAAAKYGRLPAEIGRLDLFAAAQRACTQSEVAIEACFSPAEVLMGFSQALLHFARERHLPAALPRRDVLGPLEDPVIIPEEREVAWPNLLDLAAGVTHQVQTTGHLPANLLRPGGARVGLGSIYRALAEAYLITCRDGQPPDRVELITFDRQPRIGPAIGRRYTELAECRLVVPNLNTDRLYRMAKLQTWTLAPAWYA
jgi:hypothetical protein